MLTVNLTELAQKHFPSVKTLAEETKEMNNLCYDTMLNLRCVRMSKEYDETYANWDKDFYSFDKKEYLKDVGLVTDEELVQQGIC